MGDLREAGVVDQPPRIYVEASDQLSMLPMGKGELLAETVSLSLDPATEE